MAPDWGEESFGKLLAEPMRNGVMKPRRVRGEGTHMINMGEIFAYDRLGDVPMERVPLTPAEEASSLVQADDLLFARQSLIASGAGKCALVLPAREPRTFESHLIRARLDPDRADPRFYFYYFKSPAGKRNIGTIVTQVAAAGVRSSDLAQLSVPYPPLTEQCRIARILDTLDRKIETNAAVIAKTEQLGHLLFERTFGQYLDDGEVDESRLPVSWESAPIEDVFDVAPRRQLRKGEVATYLDMKSMPTNGHRPLSWTTREAGSGTRFINGDTLVARITPCLENGKIAFVDFLQDGEVGWGSTEYIVLRPRTPFPLQTAYFLARHSDFSDYAVRHMSGSSGRQRVTGAAIGEYRIPIPDAEALRTWGRQAGALLAALRVREEENAALRRIRDLTATAVFAAEADPVTAADMQATAWV